MPVKFRWWGANKAHASAHAHASRVRMFYTWEGYTTAREQSFGFRALWGSAIPDVGCMATSLQLQQARRVGAGRQSEAMENHAQSYVRRQLRC